MDKKFTIGKLARRAGVNIQTIRYYERLGLLLHAGRKESGYRLYDNEAFKRLKFIRHAKELGFTLEEIRGLLELRLESSKACERVKEKAQAKLQNVQQKIKALKGVEKILKELVHACDTRRTTEECPILRSIEIEDKQTNKK